MRALPGGRFENPTERREGRERRERKPWRFCAASIPTPVKVRKATELENIPRDFSCFLSNIIRAKVTRHKILISSRNSKRLCRARTLKERPQLTCESDSVAFRDNEKLIIKNE